MRTHLDTDSASSLESKTTPFIGSFQVHRFSFPNGLKLLVVEDHTSPTFAYNTWFRVGSRDEEVGRTGLAHLFEHMMFKETKNLKDGEFDHILEAAGAEGENAFTNRDYTAYVQELPKERLELITKLEADRMQNLVVDEKNFKTEREVVQNERRFRTENNPDGKMFAELFDIAFIKHPYHWPVIGYQEDLNRMTAEDAYRFYKKLYDPSRATVIVCGDVEPKEVYKIVEKFYSKIPTQSPPLATFTPDPAQVSSRHRVVKLNIQVEKLLLGYHIPEITHPDIPALQVVQILLGGGKSSRLYRSLVETGIATSAEAEAMDDKDPTLMLISVNLQKGKKAAHAESIVLKELQNLSKELISDNELQRIKNKISFGFYEGLNSNSQRARFLGQQETLAGDYEIGMKIFDKSLKISALDVREAIKKYFTQNNRSVITGVSK